MFSILLYYSCIRKIPIPDFRELRIEKRDDGHFHIWLEKLFLREMCTTIYNNWYM